MEAARKKKWTSLHGYDGRVCFDQGGVHGCQHGGGGSGDWIGGGAWRGGGGKNGSIGQNDGAGLSVIWVAMVEKGGTVVIVEVMVEGCR